MKSLLAIIFIASCVTAGRWSSESSESRENGRGQQHRWPPASSSIKGQGYRGGSGRDLRPKAPGASWGREDWPIGGGGQDLRPEATGASWRQGDSPIGDVGLQNASCKVETKTIDQLYLEALAEGGRVVIYAGGDTPDQQDYFKNLFEQHFPGITMEVIVDYSKNHNARIDIQVAMNSLVPDVVQLQTLQDFPRWKQQGLLLDYKPRSWDAIYPEFKDADGFYTGIYVIVFTNCINKNLLPNPIDWPTEAKDYLSPDLAGKIALSYPNDDDAVLFLYKLIVDKYGWDYIQEFSLQDMLLVRGTQEPGDAVAQNRSAAAPATACDMANSEGSPVVFVLPKQDPFVAWPQTAAIMKGAKNPATAKLYLNWITDKETQEKNWIQWSVRNDVAPPKGYKSVWEYPGQMDPTAFGKWMADRGAVERFRQQLQQFMGEVVGEPSPGYLDVYQDKALPH